MGAVIITSYKGRTIDPDKPVRVYRNVHNGKFSVLQDGLVVAHMDQLCLRDAKPYVNETGRQRTIRNRRKEVHAWIEGYICEKYPPKSRLLVKYNPYKHSKFCVGPEGQEQALKQASHIWLEETYAFVEG